MTCHQQGFHNQLPSYNLYHILYLLPHCTSVFIFRGAFSACGARDWPLQNRKSKADYTKPIHNDWYRSFTTLTNPLKKHSKKNNKFWQTLIWITPKYVLNDVLSWNWDLHDFDWHDFLWKRAPRGCQMITHMYVYTTYIYTYLGTVCMLVVMKDNVEEKQCKHQCKMKCNRQCKQDYDVYRCTIMCMF